MGLSCVPLYGEVKMIITPNHNILYSDVRCIASPQYDLDRKPPRFREALWRSFLPRFIALGRNALSGFVVVFNRDDYISLFVSGFDIAMRIGDLFQRITSIDNCLYLFRFDHLFEKK